MSQRIQLRRGLAANLLLITPADGEPCWTTDTLRLYIGDGSTAGGNSIGGLGDVIGPASATDTAIALFNTTTGKLLKNSLVTLSSSGAFGFPAGVKQTFAPNTTTSGLNVGSFAGAPSVLVNGDLFYDSTAGALKAQIAGSTVSLGAGGGGTPGGSTTQIQYNLAGAFAGSSNLTYASSLLTTLNAIAANTSGDGLVVANTTAAASGNQRFSPRIVLDGQGWKTTATAGSQDVRFGMETRPVQGTTNPTGLFVIGSNINAAGYTDRFTIDTTGTAYFGDTTAGKISSASGALSIAAQGTNQNISMAPSGTGYVDMVTSNGRFFVGRTTSTTLYSLFELRNDLNSNTRSMQVAYCSSGFTGTYLAGGPSVETGVITTTGSYALIFGTANTYRGQLSAGGRWLFGTSTTDDGTNTIQSTGGIKTSATTASTSTTTGSLINAGGFGNAGAAFFGGLITGGAGLAVTGNVSLTGAVTSTTTGSYALQTTAHGYTSSFRGFGIDNSAGTDTFIIGVAGSSYTSLGLTANDAFVYTPSAFSISVAATVIGRFTTTGLTVAGTLTTSAPSGGSAAAWKVGGYTAGAAVQAGKVRIEIAGVAYDLLTA